MKANFYLFLFCLFSNFSVAQVYDAVESCAYDATQDRWLVSNGTDILARANDGTLSYFGDGLASHGMEIMGDYVYAIGLNVIRAYDLATATEAMSLTIPGVTFLNGMTNDGATNIFVTDFGSSKVYRIDVSDLNNPTYEEIVSNTMTTPNGILYDGANNRLLYTSWQNSSAPIYAVNLIDNALSVVVNTNVGRIDGIDEDQAGRFYISSWNPSRISRYEADFSNPPEIITTPFINNPADIEYAKAVDTLAIPIGNDLVLVGFAPDTMITSTEELASADLQLRLQPNPVQDQSEVQFYLANAEQVTLEVFDMAGRPLQTLLNGQQPAGYHRVLLAAHPFPAGMYTVRLQVGERVQTRRLVVQSR